jgi:hypothetical protein
MKKLSISPAWVFRTESGDVLDPLIFSLLQGIHSSRKLTAAVNELPGYSPDRCGELCSIHDLSAN